MGLPTYNPIQTVNLGSPASSIVFNSIPATYTDLIVIGASNIINTPGSLLWYPNALNSGSLLSWAGIEGNGSAASGAEYPNRNDVFISDWNTGPGNGQTSFAIHIFNYANTNIYKTSLSRFSKADNMVVLMAGLARTLSAITSLTITCSAGASNYFDIGSKFTLFGIKAA